MRGNFLDIPTDCPQRDERLGWTGDIQVFAPTARFLYDCDGMLASWLADLACEQDELGTVPVYVPHLRSKFPVAPTAAWGDAAVIVPSGSRAKCHWPARLMVVSSVPAILAFLSVASVSR
jgi:alpha-L-rhamnosidase